MGVLNSFFARGWGSHPSKKLPGGLAHGEWSGLELTDTLYPYQVLSFSDLK